MECGFFSFSQRQDLRRERRAISDVLFGCPFRYHVDPKNRKVTVEPERDLISEAITPTVRPKKKKRTKKAKKKSH
jgi:hypothetical protein